ncbi:5'-3' exonuclease [Tumebacillus sp. BK434]|uniref:5'-3' exonuclease H3TH domain-containing protein n=1 Tax=Tumebacillus sp. BK434 TaxID=2512169 RepID=UPI00104AEA8B|nr:5'-3' exonuclease H3TH domain-containing protein [Tumebacillus sp. BK434]TCP55474.1 5'-3' exonuclease [Tumebacillus sp. BK434]
MQLLLIDGNHIMYSVLYRFIAKAKKRGDYEEATDEIVEKTASQFTKIIKKLARRFRPTHMVVIFDNDATNFRHQLSPIYKANRRERPKEVHPLKQRIYAQFREENIPYLYASNHEGDDLIGTLAARAEELPRCKKVILLSGDMDLAQLVTPKTQLYLINNGIFTGSWVTDRNVKSLLDVGPEQIPAIKSLLGDRTDNIKGISGLRRPNVLRVIEKYPDLEEFLQIEKSKNKTEALILRHREHVENNMRLARIICDMRFHLRWEDYLVSAWMDSGKQPESAPAATGANKPSRRRKSSAAKSAAKAPAEAAKPADLPPADPAERPAETSAPDGAPAAAETKKRKRRRRSRKRKPAAGTSDQM